MSALACDRAVVHPIPQLLQVTVAVVHGVELLGLIPMPVRTAAAAGGEGRTLLTPLPAKPVVYHPREEVGQLRRGEGSQPRKLRR